MQIQLQEVLQRVLDKIKDLFSQLKPLAEKVGLIADYVVEYGTEGIWTYRKWNSGIAECWGTYNGTHAHYSTAFGGYGYNTGDINYPTNLFIDVPEQFVSVRIDGGFGIYAGDVNTSTASTTRIYAISSASSSQPLTAKIHAIGKWK